MVFKNYRLNISIRIILIAGTLYLFFWSVDTNFFVTPILIGLAMVLQVYLLFKYIDKTNRDLTSFLESIRFSEFTRSYQIEGMGKSFDQLNKAFNDVIRDFQKVRSEKEEHFHYLQSIVQNIDVSILAFQKDGSIEMINKAAKKLFQVSSLKNIKGLEGLSKELVKTLFEIKPGENRLVKVHDNDDLLQLNIYATELKIKSKLVTLVTITNIQNVLEEQETEAWQKLIRVLTHEIMNSITPIASLSSTLDLMLKEAMDENGERPLDKETVEEIQEALKTINKRSTGLLHFVNTYRNLTRIPKPNFKIANARELFKNIQLLMEDEIKEQNIDFELSIEPEDIHFNADEQLIEQVIINLIKNSVHALEGKENGRIELNALLNKRGQLMIQVRDNGQGILEDVQDKIFIPFFTTKPSGSGIGLSLSRQIMRLHNGTISVKSIPDKETTFTLTF